MFKNWKPSIFPGNDGVVFFKFLRKSWNAFQIQSHIEILLHSLLAILLFQINLFKIVSRASLAHSSIGMEPVNRVPVGSNVN